MKLYLIRMWLISAFKHIFWAFKQTSNWLSSKSHSLFTIILIISTEYLGSCWFFSSFICSPTNQTGYIYFTLNRTERYSTHNYLMLKENTAYATDLSNQLYYLLIQQKMLWVTDSSFNSSLTNTGETGRPMFESFSYNSYKTSFEPKFSSKSKLYFSAGPFIQFTEVFTDATTYPRMEQVQIIS